MTVSKCAISVVGLSDYFGSRGLDLRLRRRYPCTQYL